MAGRHIIYTDGVPTRQTTLRTVLAAVTAEPDGQCILWPHATTRDGYGMMQHQKRKRLATHVVLELSGRPRPPAPRNLALHSCDTPGCIAPWHLRWGTIADNMADRMARQGPSPQHGTRNGRARLSPEAVSAIRDQYAAGGVTHRQLAEQHGVHHSTVQQLLRGESWASVG